MTASSRSVTFCTVVLTAAILISVAPAAVAMSWPQEITAEEGTIVVYQPQPEKLDGNLLTGRAAMSLELHEQNEPVFGAFWFEARLQTDTDSGSATIHSLDVTQVRWADSTDAGEQRFTRVVESAVPSTGFDISMERLSASLEGTDVERRSLEQLKSDPPEIVFVRRLAVLLLYDGEPRISPVEGSHYERALNTPVLVVRDSTAERLFLSDGHFWYQARDPLGPWSSTTGPPQDLARMLPDADPDQPALQAAPDIVVATRPTELVVTDGAPDWQALPEGGVLYVRNTETAWLRDLGTNNMYLLLSGRWYRSTTERGPWTFVAADELPRGFRSIPPASEVGGVRTSVAGTPEADDAVLDAQIPQTAAIRRDSPSLQVEYDGEPVFEPIPGTRVSYAVNTGGERSPLTVSRNNVYQRAENQARNAPPAVALGGLHKARPSAGRGNDVFTDRSGTVARREPGGWQTRQHGSWRPAAADADRLDLSLPQGAQRPADFDRTAFERAHQMRQRGMSREAFTTRTRGFGRRR